MLESSQFIKKRYQTILTSWNSIYLENLGQDPFNSTVPSEKNGDIRLDN